MKKQLDKQIFVVAYSGAATEHRAAGGTGAPPDELIDKHIAELTFDVTETRETPAPVAVAPTLADGPVATEYRTLRDVDGREVRCFAKGQKLSDTYEQRADGLSLEGLGAALAGIATGNLGPVRAELRALNEGAGSAGGFLVPDELSAQLVDLARDRSVVFAAGTQTVQMNSETLKIVRVLTDPSVYTVAEGTAITPSQGSFDALNLVAVKLACLTSATNELLDDGMGAGDAIVSTMAASMAAAIDDYVLTRLFANTEIGVETTVGGISYQEMLKALLDVRLLNGEANTVLCNPNLTYDLSLLTEATTNAFLAPPAELSGLRYLASNAITEDHAIVGDFTSAVVGMRKSMSIEISKEAGWTTDTTGFRSIVRLDSGVLRPHFRILDGIT